MTLTVTCSPAVGIPPQVVIDVDAAPDITGGEYLRMYRVHEDDGSRWRVILAGEVVIRTEWSGVDYHPPLNRPFHYVAETDDGQVSAASNTVLLPGSNRSWLLSPSDPSLAVMVTKILGPPKDFVHKTRAQAFEVLGRSAPVYRASSVRASEAGELTIRVDSTVERRTLKALLAGDTPVLLSTPFAEDFGWKWIQPGDVTISNPYGYIQYPHRQVTIPYIECEPPDADIKPPWTFDVVAQTYTTFDQLKAAYDTFRDLTLRQPT